jgi:hypothetical protein
MPQTLSKRERILRTIACQETDRVPLYDLLLNDGAIAHFSGQALPARRDDEETRRVYKRITGRAICNFLDMTRTCDFGPLFDRDFIDEDGFGIHESTWEKTAWIYSRPFADLDGARIYLRGLIERTCAETKAIQAHPAAYGERFRVDFLANTVGHMGDTVHLITQQGTGLDDILYRLGFQLLSYLMADDPELLSEALEAITANHIAICHATADPQLSPMVLTYCDIAYKEALLYSPRFLRKEIFPRVKRLNEAWHEHGIACLYHSDGYLMDVLDDLVATGIDGLNPIEIVAGMDLAEVRRRYPRLFLAGGIDMSQLLSNGEPGEVKEACRAAIRDAYPGFFMGSTTEADNSCKPENLIAMYEVAMEGFR